MRKAKAATRKNVMCVSLIPGVDKVGESMKAIQLPTPSCFLGTERERERDLSLAKAAAKEGTRKTTNQFGIRNSSCVH